MAKKRKEQARLFIGGWHTGDHLKGLGMVQLHPLITRDLFCLEKDWEKRIELGRREWGDAFTNDVIQYLNYALPQAEKGGRVVYYESGSEQSLRDALKKLLERNSFETFSIAVNIEDGMHRLNPQLELVW